MTITMYQKKLLENALRVRPKTTMAYMRHLYPVLNSVPEEELYWNIEDIKKKIVTKRENRIDT